MFRTRDFLLLFSTVTFLVFAIGGTLIMRFFEGTTNQVAIPEFAMVDVEPLPLSANVSATDTLARSERLEDMRRQIALRTELISAPATSVSDVAESSPESATVAESAAASPMLCSGYQAYQYAGWNPQNITIEEVEGVRLVRSMPQSTNPDATQQFVTEFVLPMRLYKSGEYCLSGDVIGVAKDGSLIRNNEIGLYGVFDAETIIGYALDGLPIRGSSTIDTDSCGGTSVDGQYAYYLNPERKTILNCFAAEPTQ